MGERNWARPNPLILQSHWFLTYIELLSHWPTSQNLGRAGGELGDLCRLREGFSPGGTSVFLQRINRICATLNWVYGKASNPKFKSSLSHNTNPPPLSRNYSSFRNQTCNKYINEDGIVPGFTFEGYLGSVCLPI